MHESRPLLFTVTAGALLVMLAGFFVLSIDVNVRVWQMREELGSAVDAAVLLSYESARALTTAMALVLGTISFMRATSEAQRAFTLLMLFLALWYTKSFGFAGFPGHGQERLAEWLLGRGVSRGLLVFVFGAPVWAAWLALGALLRVSTSFPKPLEPSTIERSGDRDRDGLMRGTSVAGSDIGAISRRVAAVLLRRGAFRALPVWLLAGFAGVLRAVTRIGAVNVVLDAVFVVLVILALTNLRAATMAAPEREKRRALWMLQAAIAATAAFAVTAAFSLTGDGVTGFIPFGLAALTPPVVLMGVAQGIARIRPPDPRPAIHRTLLIGVAAVTTAAIFAISAGAVRPLARPSLADAVAALIASATTLILRSKLRRLAGRISSNVIVSS